LDFTNQDFLKDINEEHLKNTYPEFNKQNMKNFIKFTNVEFDAFNKIDVSKLKHSQSPHQQLKSNQDPSSLSNSEQPYQSSQQVSEAIDYLQSWQSKIKKF